MMNTKLKQNSNPEIKLINNNINQNKIQAENDSKQNISEILKDNLKIQIDSLVDMGFERSQVEIAVKAANGRIDLAIEYLNYGIPDNIRNRNNNNNMRNNNNNRNEIMQELKKQAGIIKVLCKDNKFLIFSILNNIKKNDPGLLRLITDYQKEFEKLLDLPITEEDEQYYKSIETKADNILNKRREEKEKKMKEREKNQNNKNNPEDNKEENKDKKEDIQKGENKEENNNKSEVKEKTDKNINKEEDNKNDMKIEEDKEEEKVKEKIDTNINKEKDNKKDKEIEEEKEKGEEKDKNEEKVKEDVENKENKNIEVNNYNNNNPIQNQLTEEDNQVIDRLKNLGDFPREKVVEAYIVCNKNEELTANYLFEQYN